MPPRTRTAPRSKAVPRLAIEQAESFLQDLPKRAKEILSISEAIGGMADTVRAALAKGYSYDEISDMLSDKLGISVSAWSLRRYIPAGSRRGKRGVSAETEKPKRGRRKKEKAPEAISPTPIVEETPAPAVEVTSAPVEQTTEPAPTQARRRTTTRGKAAVKTEAEAQPAAKTKTTRSRTSPAKQPATTKTQTSAKSPQGRRKKS